MKDSLLPSALVSCAAFSALTLPLVASGSKVISIEFQKEQIFVGRLRDVAMPYLGVAAAVSLGAGAVSLSMREWSTSSKRSSQVQKQLNQLQAELQEKEKRIEELQLTDSFLEVSGLDTFLEPEKAIAPVATTAKRSTSVIVESNRPQPRDVAQVPTLRSGSAPRMVAEASEPTRKQPEVLPRIPVLRAEPSPIQSARSQTLSNPSMNGATAQVAQPNGTVHAVTAFTKASVTAGHAPSEGVDQPEELATRPVADVLAEVNELQAQMNQMAERMKTLQSSLKKTTEVMPTYVPDSSSQVIEHLHQRLQLLESNWVQQRPAS